MFCTLTDSGKNDFRIGIMNRIGNVRHFFTTGIVSGCSWYDRLYDELLIWWLFISPSILHVLYVVKNKFPCLDVFSCVSVTMSDQMMFESSCLPFGLWSLCFLMLFVFILYFPTSEVIIESYNWPASVSLDRPVTVDGSIQVLKISIKGASGTTDVDLFYPNGIN